MDSSNAITESYNFQDSLQNDFPMDIRLSNDGLENKSVVVQNYVIKRLDDGNLELVFCNNVKDSSNSYKQQDIPQIESAQFQKQNVTFELDLEVNTRIESNESSVRSVEVPVIRSHPKDSVIHHAPTLTHISKATAPTQSKSPRHQVPLSCQPERILLNVTIYSCFKCSEQFHSLTLFRQHLKLHRAEKNFNCPKCSSGFNDENNLKIHMVTSHPGHHTDVCPICKIKFQRKASLKSHIVIHQVEEYFTCDECHGEFENDDDLLKHMEVHAVTRVTKTLSDSLVCPYCKLDFQTLMEYKKHIEKHVEVKRNVLKGKKVRKKKLNEKPGGYRCKYCSKLFSKSCLLDRHERIHTGERPYVCTYCKRAFAQKGTLQIHLGSHTGEKPYSCTLCQAKFTQKGNLRAHIEKTHTAPKGNQKIYRCTQCPCIFRKVASLNGHITKVHLNQDEQESENMIDKVMDGLKMLNNELGKSALKRAEPKRTPSSPPSKVPGLSTVRLAESHANGGVRRYMLKQKKIGDVRWYFCSFCSSKFKKPSDLIRHFRTHTLEKPYKCTKCNQAFSLKTTLINHYKVHNTSACQCSHCDVQIRNSRSFNAHVKSHETKIDMPKYACVLCDAVFVTFGEGKQHRLVHAGEIPANRNIIEQILKQPLYETTYGSLPMKQPKSKVPNTGTELPLERPHHCKQCDARFTRLISLKRHVLYHAGERKFRCTLCPKAFITKYRLKEHVNYHKNIRNYRCQTCGKKFVTASLLKRHTIVHNNFKPYLCPYCDKKFKTLLLCRSHIKTIHKLHIYFLNGEGPSENAAKVETMSDSHSQNTNLATLPIVSDTSTSKESDSLLKSQREAASATGSSMVDALQDSELLSVLPQDNQQESDPGYEMVYLNIGDLPVTNADGVLNGDDHLLTTLKMQNNSLLFNSLNDLQDSSVLFNMDPNKPDMVDPNEVIKSISITRYTSSVISQNTSNSGKYSDMATKRRDELGKRGLEKEQTLSNLQSLSEVGDLAPGQQGISMEEFSTVDLDELPISIIGIEDEATLSPNLANDEMNINPNDMFYNAQVLCINCHKMFSDMNVFQKHVCSQSHDTDRPENLNLLIQEQSAENLDNRLVDKVFSPQNLPNKNIKFDCTNMEVQESENNEVDTVLQGDFFFGKESLLENNESYLNRLKRFKNKKPLLADVAKLEKSKMFRCRQCNFFTSIEERYRKHLNFVHAQSMDRVCKFCFKDFQKLSDLVRHLRTHTGERPFECEKCHKKFSLKSTLESHLRTHEINSVTKISCDVCNSNFSTKSSLKVHMMLHTGARPHACNFCEQTFRTSAIRRAHEKNIHLRNIIKQPVTNKPKSGRRLVKSVAESVANDIRKEREENMGDTSSTNKSETLVIQPSSDALILNSGQDSVTIDPAILLQHLQNSGIILTANDEGTVPLNLNDITLIDYETLKASGNEHVDFLGNVENFQYQLSDPTGGENNAENIESLQYVQDVTRSNENERKQARPRSKRQKTVEKVECDICHKLYASKDVLRKHKKNVHGQNKKFPCIKCDKGYDSLDELNRHIVKLHTGCRPYACQYCANSFSEENSLKTHIKRIHQKSVIAQETTNALLTLQLLHCNDLV